MIRPLMRRPPGAADGPVSGTPMARATSPDHATAGAAPTRALADVGSLLVTPHESLRCWHLVDHGMALGQRVAAGVALL